MERDDGNKLIITAIILAWMMLLFCILAMGGCASQQITYKQKEVRLMKKAPDTLTLKIKPNGER